MNYYKGTKQQCLSYNNTVNEQQGFKPPVLNWANVREIDSNFYIIKHPLHESQEMELTELPKIVNEDDI